MEARRTHAFVGRLVTHLVVGGTLRVQLAAAQAITRGRIAVRKPATAGAVGAAIAWVETGARVADETCRTIRRAIAAKAWVVLGVDAAHLTRFEPRCADALVVLDVADFIIAFALLGFDAPG